MAPPPAVDRRSPEDAIQFDELRFVCQQAAQDHAEQSTRPLVPAIVLPGPKRTRIIRLPDFPEDDEQRHVLIRQFAKDEVEKNLVPCWGFVAEAAMGDQDVVIAVYGARRHAPVISAAPFEDDGLGAFLAEEPLDPTAMPFLHPLQHAVDAMSTLAEGSTPLDEALGGMPAAPEPPGPPTGPGGVAGRQLPMA